MGELDPAGSQGDLFYVGSYFCMTIGMILAECRSRRLNLELWQLGGKFWPLLQWGWPYAAWSLIPSMFGLDASNAIADGAVDH